jgi:hypothetical protein
MVKSPLARILLGLAALTLIAVTALALGSRQAVIVTGDGRHVIATKGSSKVVLVHPGSDTGLTTIAGNLSKDSYAVYFCCYGSTIAGPNAGFGHTYWVAQGFTPSVDATVTKLKASVGFVEGVNEVVLSLYSDSNGIPGTALFSKRTKVGALGNYGDCCILADVNYAAGAAITAGTPYWVVVSTDKNSTTTFAAWTYNTTDMRQNVNLVASYVDGTWTSEFGLQGGFAVLGN